ncbi:MAG: TRAP transporter large permease subunit, partial [Pseudomonadota bacterium]
MTPFDIGLIALVAICLLVMSGLFVPIALILCSFVGVWAIKGSPDLAAKMLGLAANDAIQSYFFGVVPLFVLMGFIVAETGMGRDAYDVAAKVFRRLRGGLGVSTVAANAVFASITGISIASAAVFTKIAVPEMVRYGYPARVAAGIVAGSSILGMLIPPSLLLILYGLLAEQSIGDLFLAGIGPGLLLTVIFGIGVCVMAKPSWGREGAGVEDDLTLSELISKILPIAALIFLVIGGIYLGFFTPVEAGAMGAIGALIIGVLKRRLTVQGLWRVMGETGLITAAICFLIIAANMYSRMLAFSGLPAEFGTFVASNEIQFWAFIALYVLAVILMGMILDSASIMLILVPLM